MEGESCPFKESWDMALSNGLRESTMKVFKEDVQHGKVKFTRVLTPLEFTGPIIWPVESKAKLTPLDHKGNAAKAEMYGAVFVVHLKKK